MQEAQETIWGKTELRIQLLGGFVVALGDAVIPAELWKGQRARSMVKLLALTPGHRLHRDQVVDLLWPDSDLRAATNNFHQTLFSARRVLDTLVPGCLLLDNGLLSLSGGAARGLSVDVDQFEAAAQQAKGCADPALYEAALGCYPGDLLPDDRYEEWTLQRRESLRQMYLGLLLGAASLYESRKEFAPAVQRLSQLVASDRTHEEAHAALMRVYALSGRRQMALRQYQVLRDVLWQDLAVEPSQATNRLYAAIREDALDKVSAAAVQSAAAQAAAATGAVIQDSDAPAPGEPPFKGLQFFDVGDSDIFFGREALTQRLVDHLQAIQARKAADAGQAEGASQPGDNILAVVGASGSGKSSVVRAGLAAIVARNVLASRDNERWTVRIITPTNHPLASLSAAAPEEQAPRGPRLLVVDQFEELFVLSTDEAEREAFINQLVTCDDLVVISLRADFYAHCTRYPALRRVLSMRQELIGPMSMAELRRAIEEPARRGGWVFEAGLTNLLLHDLDVTPTRALEPGTLPLLSHALMETWQRRSGHTLTLKGYVEAGSVHGVIAKTAETVYENLSVDQQLLTRNIFLRMTTLGEGTQETRHPVGLDDLVPAGSNREATREVLRRLADARLVVVGWDQQDNQEEFEIVHEALIRYWPRLQGWIEENQAVLTLEKRIRDAAQEWDAGGRDNSLLGARNPRLDYAMNLALTGRLGFNQLEMDYMLAYRTARERLQKARDQRRRTIIGLSLLVALTMALIAAWGLYQAGAARHEAQISLARDLAIQARELMTVPSMNEVAVLLVIESMRLNPDRTANEILASSLSFFPNTIAALKLDRRVTTSVFSPDGRQVATAGSDHIVRVWDARNAQILAQMAHDGDVWAVAFSPDGSRLASASQDGSARVWDVAGGRMLARMAHGGAVWSVAFSPDGKWLATGSEDGTARVWDAATGAEISRVQHDGIVYAVAFSPDGKQVISASQDHTLRLWDPSSGREALRMHNGSELWAVAFSPDGGRVVSGGWDGVVRVWDTKTGQALALMQHNNQVRTLAFSPDGALIISGSDDGTARIWDAGSGREVTRAQSRGRVLSVGFSPDGRLAVSGSEDGTARVWEVDTGTQVTQMQHGGPVTTVMFSADSARVLSSSADGMARVWALKTGRELVHMQHDGAVSSVTFSQDGSKILSGGADGLARIWDVQADHLVIQLLHGSGGISQAAFSADGKRVITGSKDSTARIWDAGSGLELARLVQPQRVLAAAFNPDGKLAVTGGQDGIVRVWDIQTQQVLVEMHHTGPVNSVAFSPGGNWLLSASQDGTARVWDAGTGRELARMTQDAPLAAAAFSPDATMVVSGGADGTLRLWDAKTGKIEKTMNYASPVSAVAFSRDGRLVLSGHQDGTARVWDVANGQELVRMKQDSRVTSVAFSPDGKDIATGSQDGSVDVWLWRDADLIQLACSRLTRNLTAAEWQKYLGDRPYHVTCPNLKGDK